MRRRTSRTRGITRVAAALLLGSGVAGCSGTAPPGAGPAAGGFPPPFEPTVYGVVVEDEVGDPYDHPFLGGLNIPRPQWVDIDADGDLDLFLQEKTGEVMFFEATGAGRAGYELREMRYGGLDVGEWFRFADFDSDGDPDLLAEKRFSYVQLFRNVGVPGEPEFALATDSLRDANGEALFSDRQNIPNVADIDCDDALDLFIGRLTGTITRYEALEDDASGVPRFRHLTDRFEDIEIVAELGSLHGANTLAFTDIDQDGDEDLFWGDFFEAGLLLIENRGSCDQPSLRTDPVAFPTNDPVRTSGYNAPTFGDFDGDGDEDLLMGVLGGAFNANLTTADNLYYMEQGPDGSFALRTTRFLSQIDVGSESIPSLADLDGDGDLDLYLANKIDPTDLRTSFVYRFINVGDAGEPRFRLDGKLDLGGQYHLKPEFGDLDGDGDLDLILGSWQKTVAYYRNDGSPTEPRFTLVDEAIVTLTRGSNTTPALVDIDADGDLDLFVGEASGALNYYRNDGGAFEPAFTLVSDEYGGIDPGRRSFPTFVDLDRDGDQDLVLGHDAGPLVFYRNVGTRIEPAFELDGSFSLPTPPFSSPEFADIDADGDPDLVSGGIGGGALFYRNEGGPGTDP